MAHVFETIGANTGDSRGVAITANSTINTWGSYAEISASTSNDWDGFYVNIGDGTLLSGSSNIIEIATGSASSEVAVAYVLLAVANSDQNPNQLQYFPFPVASGSRISARMSSSTSSSTVDASVLGIGTSQAKIFKEGSSYEGLGLNATSAVKGTTIDPGASANTKGSWVELDASTANAVNFIGLSISTNETTHSGTSGYLLDIGTGAAASETVIIDNIPLLRGSGNDELLPHQFGPFAVDIASGTRIAVRAQSSTPTLGDRDFEVILQTWEVAAGGGSHTLTCTQGSYSLTGQSMTGTKNTSTVLAQGSYSLTGQTMTGGIDYSTVANNGSYSLTGQSVTFEWDHLTLLDQGSYTLSGQVINLQKGFTLNLTNGSYSLTGQDTSLKVGHLTPLDQGSYTLTGNDITLSVSISIVLDNGSYSLTGNDMTFMFSKIVNLETGFYTLTGQTVALIKTEITDNKWNAKYNLLLDIMEA